MITFWKRRHRHDSDAAGAKESIADTEQQLRTAQQNWAEVREASGWARRTQQANGFTELFLATIREGNNS